MNERPSRKSIAEQLEEVRQKLLQGGTDLEWIDDPAKEDEDLEENE